MQFMSDSFFPEMTDNLAVNKEGSGHFLIQYEFSSLFLDLEQLIHIQNGEGKYFSVNPARMTL